jgi:hypothetical protein
MKKKLSTALFCLVTTLGFADEVQLVQPSTAIPIDLTVKAEKKAPRKSFGYVRMGIADSDVRTVETLPGLGAGYRLDLRSGAVDFSANYTRQSVQDEETNYFYTVPKVSYLRYWNPASSTSFYYGAGLAWGGLKNEATDFMGLVPNASIGYEMNRNASWRSFVQFDVSQPAIALDTKSPKTLYASVSDLPGPLLEASVGVGF